MTLKNYLRARSLYLNRRHCKSTPVRCALIDMDGVLYDSMPWHAKAWQRMMSEVGVECELNEFFLYEGMTGGATIDLLFQRAFGRNASSEEIRDLYAVKSKYFQEFKKKAPMPGADRMIERFKELNLRRILVTGSAQSSLLESLKTDYPGAFEEGDRITALDVRQGKPHPEPYLKGLSKAGCSPEEAVVIENAPLGVRAGVASGCFTIAVMTGPVPRATFEKEQPDMIFDSMPAFADFLQILSDNAKSL